MIKIFIILLLIVIITSCLIIYINATAKMMEIQIKIDKSYTTIEDDLNQKYELMKSLAKQIKKVYSKKDYLKSFNKMDIQNISIYELDEQLDNHYELMLSLKEDSKKMQTSEIEKLVQQINDINQNLIAAKKYFNKNNNNLMKLIKGYYKIIAKISKIKVNTLFQIKKEKK